MEPDPDVVRADPPRARGFRSSHRGAARRRDCRHLPRAPDDARRHPLIRRDRAGTGIAGRRRGCRAPGLPPAARAIHGVEGPHAPAARRRRRRPRPPSPPAPSRGRWVVAGARPRGERPGGRAPPPLRRGRVVPAGRGGDRGGRARVGAHAALLAREKRIPVVAGPPGIVHRIRSLEEVLVDGSRGTIVASPDAETRRTFQARREAFDQAAVRCRGACREPAFTLDRELVTVEANLGAHDDVELAIDNGADGVGLFRIEQLYLARALPPSEDELFEELRALTAPLRGRPVTIRLLDVGGDKPVPFLPLPVEPNPSLGRRGVRLLLEYPQLV